MYLGLLEVLGRTFDAALLLRRARHGPWRAEVAEESMVPTLLPADWLLLDPTCRRWPRPGSIVVLREPGTGIMAIKRVAARGRASEGAGSVTSHMLPGGIRTDLSPREAWVVSDSPDGSVDSRRYGPVDADDLVARAWFRYGPLRRVGRLR
jgi:signal peptidase I